MRVQNLLFILISLTIIATGCEFSTNSETAVEEQQFIMTNDVMSRVTFSDEYAKEKSNAPSASADATDHLNFVAQVDPPNISGGTTRASHLYYDGSNSIIIGYKVRGGDFGGGIDIITSGNGNPIDDARAYQSEIFDVQEVVYDRYEDVMFVAGASYNKGSLVLKVNPDNAEIKASATIEGNVAKSLDISYHNNPDKSKLYVVSDLNDLYRFNKDLSLTENGHLEADEGVEFRSVGARDNSQVFTLDLKGNVYRTNPSYNKFLSAIELTNNQEFKSDLAIGRISYFNETTPDDILIATNQYGFGVLNPSGQTDWSSSEEVDGIQGYYYTSITGYQPDGPPGQTDAIIYAAGVTLDGRAIIDVLSFSNNKNLNHIDTLDLSDFDGVNGADVTNAQINHVYATGDYLYVAKSTDGVLIFEIED